MTPDEASSRAWSVDGVSFRYRGPIGAQLRLGGYVLLSSPAGERLGQVLSQDVVEVDGRQAIEGHGRLVAAGADPQPFEDSDLAPAPVGLLRETLHDRAAPLEVGSLRFADEVGAALDAKGFNRHTFLCGQSGSGKTYALGLLLEQLVLHTRLPLLVLDPNGDHVHLGRTDLTSTRLRPRTIA
jgi:uncharacterized protein